MYILVYMKYFFFVRHVYLRLVVIIDFTVIENSILLLVFIITGYKCFVSTFRIYRSFTVIYLLCINVCKMFHNSSK